MANREIMRNPLVRKRLKDRIVESVARAVKKIQASQLCNVDSTQAIHLTNSDPLFHRLVEHLDHSLLHGLRNISNGYWAVVQDFTHSSVVRQIKLLTNVTTNLGRGRAWLYIALADHLLESYLHCFITQHTTVQKFYLKEAIALDHQIMQLLLTLSSGLEQVSFDLDVNVPYLDLCSHMKCCRRVSEDEDDTPQSSPGVAESVMWGDGDDRFSKHTPVKVSASLPIMAEETACEKPILARTSSYDTDPKFTCGSQLMDSTYVEVIRVKRKVGRGKKLRTSREMNTERSSQGSPSSLDSDLPTPESGYRSVMENSRELDLAHELSTSTKLIENLVTEQMDSVVLSELDTEEINTDKEIREDYLDIYGGCKLESSGELGESCGQTTEISLIQSFEWKVQCDRVSSPIMVTDRLQTDLSLTDTSRVSPESDIDSSTSLKPDNTESSFEESVSKHELGVGRENQKEQTSDGQDQEGQSTEGQVQEGHSTDGQVQEGQSIEGSSQEEQCMSANKHKKRHSAEVGIDNNTKLLLMLEVLQTDDEAVVKMYETSVDHTEGERQSIYLLISTTALYLLTTIYTHAKYQINGRILFTDLDYISLSIHSQVINIVCTNRRKQFWITTGDEELTGCIVQCLDETMRAHSECRLSVLTDATHQKIAMKKWISLELNLNPVTVNILSYNLVHWDDMKSMQPGKVRTGVSKEGPLFYKAYDSYVWGSVWKPGYFVLKHGLLYQYADQHAKGQPIQCIQLNHDGCQGCRRRRDLDKPFCFELQQSGSPNLLLSAAQDTEATDWIKCLCQAVSDAMGGPSSGCVSCCCVVISNTVVLCYEDVQTNFIRMLASVALCDITSVQCDEGDDTYLILSVVNQAREWVLYFNSQAEKEYFTKVLRTEWLQQDQVALEVSQVLDVGLRAQCRETCSQLRVQRRP